jgi:hypothetical protein
MIVLMSRMVVTLLVAAFHLMSREWKTKHIIPIASRQRCAVPRIPATGCGPMHTGRNSSGFLMMTLVPVSRVVAAHVNVYPPLSPEPRWTKSLPRIVNIRVVAPVPIRVSMMARMMCGTGNILAMIVAWIVSAAAHGWRLWETHPTPSIKARHTRHPALDHSKEKSKWIK